VTSYDKSAEWALEVTAWTWNGKTYTPSEEGLNDIAVLQSTTPYIAVPQDLWIDFSFELEMNGFDCTTSS
jgi:hypothetical protein